MDDVVKSRVRDMKVGKLTKRTERATSNASAISKRV